MVANEPAVALVSPMRTLHFHSCFQVPSSRRRGPLAQAPGSQLHLERHEWRDFVLPVAPPTLEETIRARLDSLQAQSSFYAKQSVSRGERSRFAPTYR